MSENNQVTGRQIAAGRALAGISQDELARTANVSVPTLRRMEASEGPASGLANNVGTVRRALEAAGILFVPGNGEGPGVRLKKSPEAVAVVIDQKIEALETHLETEEVRPGPSPEAAMQALERARKKDEVVKLKNKRTKLKKR